MLSITPCATQSSTRVRILALAVIVPMAIFLMTACSDSTSPSSTMTVTKQAGNNQTDTVAGTLPIPLQVLVTNSDGVGVPGVTVNWVASGGNPSIGSVVTDANGIAQFSWTLETTAGEQTMTATATGLPAVVFVAIATAGSSSQVVPVSGDAQSATHGSTLTSPLVVEVIDQYGNPVAGATVAWAVTAGGGALSNGTTSGTTVTTTTIADGQAQTTWTLGALAGSNTVTATVGTLAPATFGATGL
jgi:hypothetical protein